MCTSHDGEPPAKAILGVGSKPTMDRRDLIETWRHEERQPFSGWDFSYLEGRMEEERPPWSYTARAAELMGSAVSMLDMGTGGGERLLTLREHWPVEVVVTEDYAPNVRLATERFAPLVVRVVEAELTETGTLPFADGEFDLVLNRHSGLNHGEVARVLSPGGTFLSEQVHGLWAQDLIATFDAEPAWPHETLDYTASRLERAGLTVVSAQDWTGRLSFTDVGAIVYYLKAVPWLVDGFSVPTHVKPLLALQERLERGNGLVFEAGTYLVEARKEPRAMESRAR